MKRIFAAAMLAGTLMAPSLAHAQFVRIAPPEPVVEVVPPSPGPTYVWVPGYHRWDGRHHVWVRGEYRVPDRGMTRWEPARWEREGDGYRFHAGGWR
jgi:hypothetical protein